MLISKKNMVLFRKLNELLYQCHLVLQKVQVGKLLLINHTFIECPTQV